MQISVSLSTFRESPRARLLLSGAVAMFLTGFLYFPATRVHSDFYYFAVLLPFLLMAGREDWKALLAAPTLRWTALLIGYLLLTLAWRENAAELGVYDPLRHGVLIWSLVAVIAFVTAGRPAWLVDLAPFMAIVAALVASVSMWIFYQDNPFPGTRLENQVGLRDNPIGGTVPMAMIAIAGLAALLASGPLWRRGLGGLGLFAAMIFIIATQSRSILLGVIVAAVVLLALHRYRRTLGFFALIVMMIVLAIELTPGMRGLIERGDTYRFLIWSDAVARIREAPWFGHGFNADLAFDMGHRATDSSHNIWLTAWLQGGVVGVLLLAGLVGQAGRTALQWLGKPEARIALALFAFALTFTFFNVHNIVARFAPHLTTSLWLAAGVLAGLEMRQYQRSLRTPE